MSILTVRASHDYDAAEFCNNCGVWKHDASDYCLLVPLEDHAQAVRDAEQDGFERAVRQFAGEGCDWPNVGLGNPCPNGPECLSCRELDRSYNEAQAQYAIGYEAGFVAGRSETKSLPRVGLDGKPLGKLLFGDTDKMNVQRYYARRKFVFDAPPASPDEVEVVLAADHEAALSHAYDLGWQAGYTQGKDDHREAGKRC